MLATGKRVARKTTHKVAHDDAGFTLIEMLAALAIMALITGIAFPALERRIDASGQMAARGDITLVLTRARSDAIGSGNAVRLSLTREGRLVSSSHRAPVILPQGVSVVWPEGGFIFYPDGSASGGFGEIHDGAMVTRFAVRPGTGRLAFAA